MSYYCHKCGKIIEDDIDTECFECQSESQLLPHIAKAIAKSGAMPEVEEPDRFPRDGLIALRKRFLERFSENEESMFYAGIMLCNAVMWYEDNRRN